MLFVNSLAVLILYMSDISTSKTNIDKRYTIENDENVIRLLSFPSCLDSRGRLNPVAFSLYHSNEDYVSISRLFYSSKDECIELGWKIKVWPNKEDVFAGLAELNAGEIRKISSTQILLASKYEEKFKAHAGISFKDEDGVIYINKEKGTPTPKWIIPFQQRLCLISKVEKIDLKKHSSSL